MKVKSVAGRMEPNYEAGAKLLRYVGWTHKAGTWTMMDEPVEVPDRAEYRAALRRGSLAPACELSTKIAKGSR